MSRGSTYFQNGYHWAPSTLPLYSQTNMAWTIPSDIGAHAQQGFVTYNDSQAVPNLKISLTFDLHHFFDNRAVLVAAAFYNALQASLGVSNMFKPLMYVFSADQDKLTSDLDDDLRVDMPPRSTRKVVMRARYTGRGKPLAFFDPLPED